MKPSPSRQCVTYTPDEIDALALASSETVVAEPGRVISYDVEAYQRVERRAVETGRYRRYDPPAREVLPVAQPVPPHCIERQPYHLRIGGFRREGIFGPDEAAKMLADAGVTLADSLGQGLFEHLLLCRKYGVTPVFEAPALGFPYPFLERELPVFQRIYRQQVAELVQWIERAEAVYGHAILKQPGQPWILWGPHSPLALFMLSAAREPEQTGEELKSASGILRLEPDPQTPRQRAAQLRAWAFVRRRHMEVRAVMADILREQLAPDAVLIDNAHTLPVLDYERLGQIYDHPGVAMRSGYLEQEGLREPNVAYAVRLFSDLTGKLPIASVRINNTAAGTRFIPGPNAVRQWCDAAIRHGVAGFYFWPVDYPSCEGQYFGAMPGNPDPSAEGRARWDAMLDVFRSIAGARRFRPPRANVGILVPCDFLELEGWRRVMKTFVILEEAHVWSQLLSGPMVERRDDALDGYDAVVAPACPFVSDVLADRLERFVHRGGILVITDPEAMRYDTDGKPRTPFAGLDEAKYEASGATPHGLGRGKLYFIDDIRSDVPFQSRDTYEWVYRVGTSNVRQLTGQAVSGYRPKPEPDVNVRHYLYEHSSSAIMPHIDERLDFPGEEGLSS